jgi:hypothetical protein
MVCGSRFIGIPPKNLSRKMLQPLGTAGIPLASFKSILRLCALSVLCVRRAFFANLSLKHRQFLPMNG